MSRILVVDDDPDIRLLLRYELTPEGHEVVEADNGQAALDRLAEGGVDLVLLDIMMPELDGWGVLRRLGPGSPPVLVITAGQNAGHVADLLELGALDVLLKPFDVDRTRELIAAVLLVDQGERDEYRRRRITQARGCPGGP